MFEGCGFRIVFLHASSIKKQTKGLDMVQRCAPRKAKNISLRETKNKTEKQECRKKTKK